MKFSFGSIKESVHNLKHKPKIFFTTFFVIILGIVSLFTILKEFFSIDLLDNVNNSLAKKQFAEAYGGSSCGFQTQNSGTPNPNFDFSSGATNLSINSSTPASLPFDFYYTGKKYSSIYLNNTQLLNISTSTQNAITSSFSFDGLGASSKSYFTNDVRSAAFNNGGNYSWNLGLPINNTNNFKFDSLKTKTFGTAPNRTFVAQFDISPSQAAPGPVDRQYVYADPFSSSSYPVGQWDWNNKTIITDGQPLDIYVLQDKGDINLDDISIVNVTANGTKGTAVKDVSNKKITYTPNLGETGDDSFSYTYTDGNANIVTETVTVKLGSISSNIVTLDGNTYSNNEFHDDIVVVDPSKPTIKFNPFRNDILNESSSSYSIKLLVPGGGFGPSLYTGDGTDTVVNRATINADHSIEISSTDVSAGDNLRYQVYDQNNFYKGMGSINLIFLPQNNIQHGIALEEDSGSFASFTNTALETISGTGNTAIYQQNIVVNSKGFGYSSSELSNEYNLELTNTQDLNQMRYFEQLNCPVNAQVDNASVVLGSSVDIPVLVNDSDFEYYRSNVDSPLTLTIDSPPVNGTATINPDNTITFTSTTPYSGDGYFSYKLVDTGHYSQSTTESATDVYIDIDNTAINQPPTISDFSKSTNENTTLNFTVSDFTSHYDDPENENLSKVKITQLPLHGTLKLNGVDILLNQEINSADLGNLSYVPNTSYVGSDLVKWNASDSLDYANATANINISVVSLNQPPTANSDNTNTNYNTPKTIDVITNDTDPEDPNNLITVCAGSLSATGGTVTLGGDNRSITFTPTTNSITTGSFTYKACDSEGLESLPVTSSVDINNQPPTVSNFAKSTNQNTTLGFNSSDFTSHYNDPESISLAKIKISQLPTHGVLKLNNTNVTLNQEINTTDLGNLSYVPTTNYSGADLVKWNGSDNINYALVDADINITVVPVANQVPTANIDPLTTFINTPVTKDIVTNDTDPEDTNSLLKICLNSVTTQGGTINIAADNRTITFTPTLGSLAGGSYTYKVCDSEGLESLPVTSLVTITQPLAVNIEISKNKQDRDIFVDTKVGVSVKTTNPNPYADNVVTTIKLDTSKLKLDTQSVREGTLSDLAYSQNIINSLALAPFSINVSAQDQTIIEILSPDTIRVTYPNMPANSNKSIVFIVTSTVTGGSNIDSNATFGTTGPQANAILAINSQPIIYTLLPRTGGDQANLLIIVAFVVMLAIFYLNNSGKITEMSLESETEEKMVDNDYTSKG